MKRTRVVRWSQTVERDLKAIVEYITEDSPTRAYDVFNNINEKAKSLYALPDRGRIVPEHQDQGILQFRELVVPPWRIIYRVSEEIVYVLSELDSRQNVEDILLKSCWA